MLLFSGQKGFNLFSALVAAVLFTSGIMLVQTMVSTEERVSGQVFSMEENFALNDAANLARSDAVQTFNYHFRARLEDYFTSNKFPILYRNENGSNYTGGGNWDKVIEEFECQILLTCNSSGGTAEEFEAVLKFVSEKMIEDLKLGSYGRYTVTLEVKDRREAANLTAETMEKVLEEARSEGENFLEVVECDLDDFRDCPKGTFYFNIPLDRMTDEDYEKLPRITVKDLITGEETKISLLPRSNLKVYIPIRFFKAVNKSIVQYSEPLEESHPAIKEFRLGYCDTGCNTRISATGNRRGNRDAGCATSSGEDGSTEDLEQNLAGREKYNTYSTVPGQSGLKALVVDRVCKRAIDRGIPHDSTNEFINVDLHPLSSLKGMEPDGSSILNPIPDCPYSEISAQPRGFHTKNVVLGTGGAGSRLFCSQVIQVDATVVFKDKNPQYNVFGSENEYSITITDEDFGEVDAASIGGIQDCESGEDSCKPAS